MKDKFCEKQIEEMIAEAKAASERAYAPYSKYLVGAAALTSDGKIFRGGNIENASYPVGLCAERAAFSKAISEGYTDFSAVAVYCNSDAAPYPCGMCRQFMSEFSPNGDLVVIVAWPGGREIKTISELLPGAFKL
jgi:cytidine deaminase